MKKIKKSIKSQYKHAVAAMDTYIHCGADMRVLIDVCLTFNHVSKLRRILNQYFNNKEFILSYGVDEDIFDGTLFYKEDNVPSTDRILFQNKKEYDKDYIKFNVVEDFTSYSSRFQRKVEIRIYKDDLKIIPLSKWKCVEVYNAFETDNEE
jgi:hypothetical protein